SYNTEYYPKKREPANLHGKPLENAISFAMRSLFRGKQPIHRCSCIPRFVALVVQIIRLFKVLVIFLVPVYLLVDVLSVVEFPGIIIHDLKLSAAFRACNPHPQFGRWWQGYARLAIRALCCFYHFTTPLKMVANRQLSRIVPLTAKFCAAWVRVSRFCGLFVSPVCVILSRG